MNERTGFAPADIGRKKSRRNGVDRDLVGGEFQAR